MNWFSEHLRKEVGNGVHSLLWDDPWMEGVALSVRYPGLYVLTEEKDAFLKDIVHFEGGEWKFRWIRSLSQEELDWEEELNGKIQGLSLNFDGEDRWVWSRGNYSVKEAYDSIMEGMVAEGQCNSAVVWNGLVPLKVAVFVWRLIQNRVPTKDNLFKRGVLNESQIGCANGCEAVESASHLFFECPTSVTVWQQILAWLKLSSALHNNVSANLNQFASLLGSGRMKEARLSVIWFVNIWVLWKNERIFKDSNRTQENLVEEIKVVMEMVNRHS
ncbi:receptor-like kinase [Trifolium pratense]|uniref:Receptor-like kinase n=1 Tax=Trifolium pratense TaxID=57577 RepID=A0A2K3LDY2_TRIPR|nr:receptor-like kinase [Trifolium pratense]